MRVQEVLDNEILKLNNINLKNLQTEVRKNRVTWVLGAGISNPARLPRWSKLLSKMWARLSEIEAKDLEGKRSGEILGEAKQAYAAACMTRLKKVTDYKKFRNKVNNVLDGEGDNVFARTNELESAEYMWNYIEDLIGECESEKVKKELQERILKALVRNALQPGKAGEELKSALESGAIGKLAFLLKKQKTDVITYNYDDLLEFCLETLAGIDKEQIRVYCDCDEDKGTTSGKINIHHPHGALRIFGSESGKESEHIILTESSYYQMEQRAYCWENSVQAKALAETSCVFLGFSGEDYNFRRILKNVGDNTKPKHYIFITIDKLIKLMYGEEVGKINDEEFVYEGLQIINKLYVQYIYWTKHGIIPIWTTYEDLPGMLEGLGHDA